MTNPQIEQTHSECGGCSDELPGVQTYAAKFTGGGWVLVRYCPECYALARANWNNETEAVTSDPIAIALTRGGEIALLLAGIDEDEHYPASEAVTEIQGALDAHAGAQERVVNLLAAANDVLDLVESEGRDTGMGDAFSHLRDAIAREEEGQV